MRFLDYPPGNQHIPQKWQFEDDFPIPKVGYVSSLENILRLVEIVLQFIETSHKSSTSFEVAAASSTLSDHQGWWIQIANVALNIHHCDGFYTKMDIFPWLCYRRVRCIMVNHHQTTIWESIFCNFSRPLMQIQALERIC